MVKFQISLDAGLKNARTYHVENNFPVHFFSRRIKVLVNKFIGIR